MMDWMESAFSILGRIEPTATLNRARLGLPPDLFQYPRSDRAHCNLAQLGKISFDEFWPFSILGRIEPTATFLTFAARWAENVSDFQYPRSDRAHCNIGRVNERCDPPNSFQYPRSDRAHCNLLFWLLMAAGEGPFSILGRIEPTATTAVALLAYREEGFQYPRSDRAHCNLTLRLFRNWTPPAFQYPRSDRAHCNFFRVGGIPLDLVLSVSSVGSSPLQLCFHTPHRGRASSFSILGRIEPTATASGRDVPKQ